jgi:hypothetical protein
MPVELLAVLGLAALCGGWVLVQRFAATADPDQPGVEGSRCASCRGTCGDRCDERP